MANNSNSASPLLAIDAGNSRIKFGLFEAGRSPLSDGIWPECRQFQAVPVDDVVRWDVLSSWGDIKDRQSVISGSNPRAIERLLGEWKSHNWPTPFVVQDYSTIPVAINVEFPAKVGLDRLLNAVAANALRPFGRAAIVINSGTATTVDYVSAAGEFCGGAILPGLKMSAEALHHYTALLPLLPVQELGGEQPVAPGRNTREAIRNGLFWGQVGAVRELIYQLCLHRGHDLPSFQQPDQARGASSSSDSPWLVLTGGGAPVMSPQFSGVYFLPSLGMHGLVLTAWATASRPVSTFPDVP